MDTNTSINNDQGFPQAYEDDYSAGPHGTGRGVEDYGRGAYGDYNTSMGYENDYPYDSPDMGWMGGGIIEIVMLFYVVIFLLLPFYMIAVTDASVKRKYWWILGMMVPVINFICIPVYYFTKLDKLPKENAGHHVA